MVLHKRLDYGFNGYQVPPTPRAPRSVRRRAPFKKKPEDNKMCAFDLLAIVAGKLLHEGGSSSNASGNKAQCAAVDNLNNNVNTELQDEKSLKVEVHDQGSPARSFFVSDTVPGAHEQNHSSQEFLSGQSVLNSGLASSIAPDCAERIDAEKLVHGQNKIETAAFPGKVEVGSSECRELEDCKLEGGIDRIIKDEPDKFGNMVNDSVGSMCSLEEPAALDGKPPALVSSDGCAKAPLSGNHTPLRSYPENQDVDLVSRDDDENSSGCTHPRTTKKFIRAAPRIGDRRIRKILASKYWKVTPRMKDIKLSNTDAEMKPVYRSRKNYYKSQRSERLYPFKKRKHFGYNSPSNSNGEISCEFGLDSHQKGNNGATGASSSVAGQHTLFQPRDSHVKLRIKSFRVPELFIEIPESATVGSLKRTVMEAVTAILGGGLRIGILFRGKKVRDDSKTLQQTGISRNNQLDALGFSLEPNPPQASPSLCPGESPFLLPGNTPQPLSRYPPTPSVVHQGNCSSPEHHVANMGNCIESDHDSAPSPTDVSLDKNTIDSKALVTVPPMNVEALAVVPTQRKFKRSEIVQRRIRRPFSVAEVEALVEAVEKLGTGRWRDVKLRAFDNAKHRTYVDLKDKWKTLVHTARISPQQRRGEPVPQELLDRVLAAHAYWSQQQAKQQLKHQQQPETWCHNLL